MPPAVLVFRTMAVSTSFIEGVRVMEPKLLDGPSDLVFSQPLGDGDHQVGVGFARFRALAIAVPDSIIVWME